MLRHSGMRQEGRDQTLKSKYFPDEPHFLASAQSKSLGNCESEVRNNGSKTRQARWLFCIKVEVPAYASEEGCPSVARIKQSPHSAWLQECIM